MHSIVTTFREAVIKVEVANFCAAMDTLIDQDAPDHALDKTCLPLETQLTLPTVHMEVGLH